MPRNYAVRCECTTNAPIMFADIPVVFCMDRKQLSWLKLIRIVLNRSVAHLGGQNRRIATGCAKIIKRCVFLVHFILLNDAESFLKKLLAKGCLLSTNLIAIHSMLHSRAPFERTYSNHQFYRNSFNPSVNKLIN